MLDRIRRANKLNLGKEKNLYLQKKSIQQRKGNYFAEKNSYLSTVIKLFSRNTGSEVIIKYCPSSYQSFASILTMSSKKLSQEEFNGLQKSALYKIYSDLYDQKEDNRKIMEFIEKTSEAVEVLTKLKSYIVPGRGSITLKKHLGNSKQMSSRIWIQSLQLLREI